MGMSLFPTLIPEFGAIGFIGDYFRIPAKEYRNIILGMKFGIT